MNASGKFEFFVAAAFLAVVWLTTAQAGADPYLDKFVEAKKMPGMKNLNKVLTDRDLDLHDVIEMMGDDKKFAKLLAEKFKAVKDMGSLQTRKNGDQVYVFDIEVPGVPENQVVATCLVDLIRLNIDATAGVDYASRMFASRGELDISALYTFLFKDPGNRWLCESVKENKTSQDPPFSGKYCYSATFDLFAGLGSCIPDTCTEEDINVVSWAIWILLGAEPFYFIDCVEPQEWSTADIGFTCGLAFFAFMVVCASFYEIFLQHRVLANMRGRAIHQDTRQIPADDRKTEDDLSNVATTSVDGELADEVRAEKQGAKTNGGFELEADKKAPLYQRNNVKVNVENIDQRLHIQKTKESSNLGWAILHATLLSFSAVNNCKKLLSAKKTKNTMAALNGLRVLSMFWVILGHSCQFYIDRLMNPLESLELTYPLGFTAITNATLSVDTFFVLSGFLVTYLTLKQIHSVRRRSTGQWVGFWSLFYFHRWWRLTPVYMAAMGIYALLMPHFGQGSWMTDLFYEFVKSFCRRQWWTHPLYINNLYPWPNTLDASCMGWSWYLANDMQFYIISPFILVILYKNATAGLTLISSLMLVSLSALFGLNWHYGYTISEQDNYNDNVPDPETADITYAKPYTRIPTYLVGMVIGYIIFKLKGKRPKIHFLVVVAGWLAAFATLWASLYGIWISYQRMDVPQATAVLYLTFYRVAWGTAIGWIIFACLNDYGGPVGFILGLKIWIPLARLTYCAYLIHPVIIFSKVYNDAVLFHMSYLTISYVFVANVVFSYAAALVLSLLIEGPSMGLEKVMFGQFKRS